MIVLDQQTAKAMAKLIEQVDGWSTLDEYDLDEGEIMLIRRFAKLVEEST